MTYTDTPNNQCEVWNCDDAAVTELVREGDECNPVMMCDHHTVMALDTGNWSEC